MKSNICYIYSQKCALEIAKYNQLGEMKSISTSSTRLSKLDLKKKKVAEKKGPENQNVNSPCHVPVLLADAPGNSAFSVSESGNYHPRAWCLKRCQSSDKLRGSRSG